MTIPVIAQLFCTLINSSLDIIIRHWCAQKIDIDTQVVMGCTRSSVDSMLG